MTHPPARRHRCRTCRTWTLRGLDEDQCAHTTLVDPTPLTAAGEAVARLLGLVSYDLDTTGTLWRRTQYDITARPAESNDPLFPGTVVVEHQCGTDWNKYRSTNRTPATPRKEKQTCVAIPF